MPHPQARIHRMSELVEPIGTVTFSEVPNEAFLALGMRNYWDAYFAGRAAPLGLAPAEVVHAVFYNFAGGAVARHIPWVWGKTTPEEAIALRERGSAAALRQMIGELADSPGLVRVADLATRAAVSAPTGAVAGNVCLLCVLRVVGRECRTSLSANCGCGHAPASQRLRHAHPGAGMLAVAAPSRTGGTSACRNR